MGGLAADALGGAVALFAISDAHAHAAGVARFCCPLGALGGLISLPAGIGGGHGIGAAVAAFAHLLHGARGFLGGFHCLNQRRAHAHGDAFLGEAVAVVGLIRDWAQRGNIDALCRDIDIAVGIHIAAGLAIGSACTDKAVAAAAARGAAAVDNAAAGFLARIGAVADKAAEGAAAAHQAVGFAAALRAAVDLLFGGHDVDIVRSRQLHALLTKHTAADNVQIACTGLHARTVLLACALLPMARR